MSARLGHVATIDHNPRRGEKSEFSPAEARRYNERTAVERIIGHLRDEHGGRHVRVHGPVKVAHQAFGLLVIVTEQMLKMFAHAMLTHRTPQDSSSSRLSWKAT